MSRTFVVAGLVAIIPFVISACPPPRPPENYDITVFPPYGDAGDAELDVPADCRVACENLAKMGCPESAPAGRTCGSVCAAAQAAGIDLNPICVASVSSPVELRARCGTVQCEGR